MAKSKQEKHCASEINTARSKLDGVLQTLVIKNEDGNDASENDSVKTSPEVNVTNDVGSTLSVKKPSVSKPPRKRRRKDDSNAGNHANFQHSYVMKLFDRSVDLAKFGDDAPLYPICRSWMQNQPQKQCPTKSRSPSPELTLTSVANVDEEQDETKRDVNTLPLPVTIKPDPDGTNKSLRIPSPVQSKEAIQTIEIDDGLQQQGANPDNLLANHLVRWKVVRRKWKRAASLNESRSQESLSIIKSLFER